MKKNIQQLAAMAGVLEKSIRNKDMGKVISVDISRFPETKIHISKDLFLSTFREYEKGPLEYLDGKEEIFVYLEGIRVFAITNIEGVPNA